MIHYEPSHQDLLCLQMFKFWNTGFKRLMHFRWLWPCFSPITLCIRHACTYSNGNKTDLAAFTWCILALISLPINAWWTLIWRTVMTHLLCDTLQNSLIRVTLYALGQPRAHKRLNNNNNYKSEGLKWLLSRVGLVRLLPGWGDNSESAFFRKNRRIVLSSTNDLIAQFHVKAYYPEK